MLVLSSWYVGRQIISQFTPLQSFHLKYTIPGCYSCCPNRRSNNWKHHISNKKVKGGGSRLFESISNLRIMGCWSNGSLKNASRKNQTPLMNQSHGKSASPIKKFFLQMASFSSFLTRGLERSISKKVKYKKWIF